MTTIFNTNVGVISGPTEYLGVKRASERLISWDCRRARWDHLSALPLQSPTSYSTTLVNYYILNVKSLQSTAHSCSNKMCQICYLQFARVAFSRSHVSPESSRISCQVILYPIAIEDMCYIRFRLYFYTTANKSNIITT